MITVFTPSYNRKEELKNLYDSLLKQDTNDFEWLIVDDGSKDDTKIYIDDLLKQKKMNINYVYKENGGKQSAYNKGLDEAKGDIFLCIDSDDILHENILKTIAQDFKDISSDDTLAGLMYIQSYISDPEKIIGSKFPSEDMIDTYYNIYHKHKVTGDKLVVLKTKVAREYYFPLIKGEKFVPEALIFNRISLKYNFLCRNVVAALKDYLDGGYSANYFNLVKRNPQGNMLYFKELSSFNKSFYNVYGYLLFAFYSKKSFKEIFTNHPSKIKIILLYIPVYFISLFRK